MGDAAEASSAVGDAAEASGGGDPPPLSAVGGVRSGVLRHFGARRLPSIPEDAFPEEDDRTPRAPPCVPSAPAPASAAVVPDYSADGGRWQGAALPTGTPRVPPSPLALAMLLNPVAIDAPALPLAPAPAPASTPLAPGSPWHRRVARRVRDRAQHGADAVKAALHSDRALLLLGPGNPLRVVCTRVVEHRAFEGVVFAFVLASAALLAMDEPSLHVCEDATAGVWVLACACWRGRG